MQPFQISVAHVQAQSDAFRMWCQDNASLVATARKLATSSEHQAWIETEAQRLFDEDIAAANAQGRAQLAAPDVRTTLRNLSRAI